MKSNFDNLEKCTYERLLQINKNIRTLRRQKKYSKEILEDLKRQRTETDQLLSAIKYNKKLNNDNNYDSLKEDFFQAKIT